MHGYQFSIVSYAWINLLQFFSQVLKIMKTSTNIMSSSKHATASLILPTKHVILNQMNDCTDEDLPALVHEVKCTIANDLEDR